nr:hypothetical protein Q903MT_gene2911 [Picea sitchensis]
MTITASLLRLSKRLIKSARLIDLDTRLGLATQLGYLSCDTCLGSAPGYTKHPNSPFLSYIRLS